MSHQQQQYNALALPHDGDEIAYLRSQNDQLWRIIEKQRAMIQNLQKDNTRLAIERDGIMDKYQLLEKEFGMRAQKHRAASILISPEILREIAEADDDSNVQTPSTTEMPAIVTTDLTVNSPTSSPVPPPRSPFRRAASDESPSPLWVKDNSSSNSSSSSCVSPPTSPVPSGNDKARQQRRAKARESMLPPPQTVPEHDPTMRAASPPLPRAPRFDIQPPSPDQQRQHPFAAAAAAAAAARATRPSPPPAVPAIQEPQYSNSPPPPVPAPPAPHDGFLMEHGGLSIPLPDLAFRVTGSNIKTNDRGKEVISFIIAIGKRRDEAFDEYWRVEKLYSDFLDLDAKLKAQPSPVATGKISKLPDKAMFSTHAPNKVDQRKAALEKYLLHTLSLPWDDMSVLCEFLSTNMLENEMHGKAFGKKEGYLTKRGKNFGGWKSRYFILNGDVIDYFETKGGHHLGTIRLTNAQIGRQTSGVTPSADEHNSIYRHAFLLMEQKRQGSSHVTRHILCAESDEDRDDWVETIIQNIRFDDEPPPGAVKDKRKKEKTRKTSKGEIKVSTVTPPPDVPAVRKPEAVGLAISSGVGPTPSVSTESTDSSMLSSSLPSSSFQGPDLSDVTRSSLDQHLPPYGRNLHTPPPAIVRRSSMVNLTNIDDISAQPSPPRACSPSFGKTGEDYLDDGVDKKAKNKRMTFWGKKMFSSGSESNAIATAAPAGTNSSSVPAPRPSNSLTTDLAQSTSTSVRASIAPTGLRGFLSRSTNESTERLAGSRGGAKPNQPDVYGPKQVFGVPLEEAVRVSQVVEGYELPSVVYRCIEYLDAKNAVLEEGLYRLSGSSTVMKSLRQKFNKDGDVNLLESKEEYDVHAVAGLLKMWLRELPTSVLTREHRGDFLHVIDLLDRKDRVNELGRLVSQLPLANYTLLRALTAHLIRVVQHSDINKMTMRNVSIVFSPTLGIPAMIFNLFMSEFEYVFWTTEDGDAAPRMIEDEEEEKEEQEVKQEEQGTEDVPEVVVAPDMAPDPTAASSPAQQEQRQQPTMGIVRKPTLKLREEFGRSNRNSVSYIDGAPNAIVELERNIDGPLVLDEDDEEMDDLTLTTAPRSSEDDTASLRSVRTNVYPTPSVSTSTNATTITL
ncbi:hypothetical protein BX666DRAFT_1889043 [Dichotomocladium elegans]|nr:hypothetical protein BX666DRAFT_1889043 [Dichotomocladium elegans]